MTRRRRFSRPPHPPVPRPSLALERDEENRGMAAAVSIALLLHLALLTSRLPVVRTVAPPPPEDPPFFRLADTRLAPPEVPPQPAATPPPEAVKIPVPELLLPPPEPLPLARIEPPPPLPTGPAEPARVIVAPPPPAPDGAPIRFGGDMTRPVRISGETPEYTRAARIRGVEGVVVLEAVIDRSGRITRLEVLEGLPFGLEQAAVRAVRTWRFDPATLAGEPVSVLYNLTVRYRIQ